MNGEEGRMEVAPDEFGMLLEQREQVLDRVKAAGFSYVAMDLAGYRTDAMNETL